MGQINDCVIVLPCCLIVYVPIMTKQRPIFDLHRSLLVTHSSY